MPDYRLMIRGILSTIEWGTVRMSYSVFINDEFEFAVFRATDWGNTKKCLTILYSEILR